MEDSLVSHHITTDRSGIDVPAILSPLSQQDEAHLHSTINPLSESAIMPLSFMNKLKLSFTTV